MKSLSKKIQRVLENGKDPSDLVGEAVRWLTFARMSKDAKNLIAQMAEMIEALDGAADFYRERADYFEARFESEVKQREDAEFFYANAVRSSERRRTEK